jgi:hypothetical protein
VRFFRHAEEAAIEVQIRDIILDAVTDFRVTVALA